MENFLRSATTEGQNQGDALKQADSIWRMLDQMAENDPDNYQKFIGKHLGEGKEYFQMPEPEMVAVTHTFKPDGRLHKRVFINLFSWSRVPAPMDANGAIPTTGGKCLEGISADCFVCCVALNKKVFEDIKKKKSSKKDSEEIASIIGVTMKYLEEKCEMPAMSRNCKILDEEKFRGSDLKNLRKALMESKDAIAARDGMTKMAHQLENAPKDQQETMLNKVSEAARMRTSQSSTDIEATPSGEMPPIRMPGSTNEKQTKDQTRKSLIQEIKPQDRPLQKPVHTMTVLHKPNEKGEIRRELLLKVALPRAPSASALEVDVGSSDVTLFVPGCYRAEILFPQSVDKERAKANFSKKSKMLRISVPVLRAAA